LGGAVLLNYPIYRVENAMTSRAVLHVATSVGLVLYASGAVYAQTCQNLANLDKFSNRDLYYLASTNNSWKAFSSFADPDLSGRQSISFVYVAKPGSFDDRLSGVLIIKSGHLVQAKNNTQPHSEPEHPRRAADSVRLVRRIAGHDEGCPADSDFKTRWISGSAYDLYHDQHYTIDAATKIEAERNSLRQFHIAYKVSRGSKHCLTTDDARNSVGDLPANRSQFSFDPGIVSNGYQEGVVTVAENVFSWFSPPAIAATPPAKLILRRTEIIRYQIDPAIKAACIGFDLKVLGPAQYLRINDLDARKSMYQREDER
jgi:hypothetical protein